MAWSGCGGLEKNPSGCGSDTCWKICHFLECCCAPCSGKQWHNAKPEDSGPGWRLRSVPEGARNCVTSNCPNRFKLIFGAARFLSIRSSRQGSGLCLVTQQYTCLVYRD